VDFDPTLGREQSGNRPAVIISQTQYNKRRNLLWICPISSTVKPLRFLIALDERTKTNGAVICEQIRTIDLLVRKCEYVEKLPKDILEKVLDAVSIIVALENDE
jgi:mRNA interferase MazF